MNNIYLDKSNYLKGLLILIGKDKKIAKEERDSLLKLAKVLGFDKEFCENAINELLENEYIIEDPPLFSDPEYAKAFFKDGIRLAFSDHDMHLYELNWLRLVTAKNNLDEKWCLAELENFRKNADAGKMKFAIESLLNEAEKPVLR